MRSSGEPRPERLRLRLLGTNVLRLPNTIAPGDIPSLCRDLRSLLLDGHPSMVLCDAAALTHPDVAAIDALARLQLTAYQLGREIALTGASSDLKELLSLAGLDRILPTRPASPLHPIGQAEQREVPGGIQKESDPTDPTT